MKAAYEVAKRVREGAASITEGTDELFSHYKLNRSSARDTVNNINSMLDGKKYVRTNNAFATEYFLEMIYRDYGVSALKLAIFAVEQHIEYYAELPKGSKLLKVSQIAEKFRAIVVKAEQAVAGTFFTEVVIGQDLDAIEKDESISPTTKLALIHARLGQGKFREKVLHFWGNGCSVTGSKVSDAIRASHIKPWRNSDNKERLDADNGLPLIASLDALFDAGLISFSSAGVMIASSKLNRSEQDIFGINAASLRKEPTAKMANYLTYHRSKYGFDS